MINALSLRGFLAIAAAVSFGSGLIIVTVASWTGASAAQAVLFGLGGIPIGLMVAGGIYLAQLPAEISSLALRPDELMPGEYLVRQSTQSMVHYKTGKIERFWEATGGRLFLTNQRLVFLAHRGQPMYYQLELPLEMITRVEPAVIARLPGGLRVSVTTGQIYLFTFGAVFASAADEWAIAIRSLLRPTGRVT